ncbi:hypothetical protein Mgra_00001295 [Meloidogyne graminicola]|uniref:Uncharacterized protein n=1 Tax=Meloidogyne graminicola TaxID=189291 RepID=A0A8T0A010_9BILA|nr:hypothetical protein Mgra_00001295 [Meloidogyne graminicola]
MSGETRNFSALLNTKCERKMKRKAAKEMKATCRKAHSQHIKVDSIISNQLEDSKRKKKLEKRRRLRNKKRQEKIELERKKRIEGKNNENLTDEEGEDEECTIEQFREEADKARQQRLKADLDDDDREIRRLERLIKKSKRRKKGKIEVEMSEDELEKIFNNENDSSEEN